MGDMFPHVVTVYNVYTEEKPPNFEPVLTNYITVLKGVLLDESKASNVSKSGMEGADAVNLYIPADVTAVDGLTGKKQRYVGPKEFWSAEDKTGLWTLSVNRNCFFVKGEAIQPDWTVQSIENTYDSVYDVTKVDFKDYGGDMSHWQVGGA